MLPYLSTDAPWFGFVGHLRDRGDLYRMGGTSLLRRYSRSDAEFVAKACSLPPLVVGEVRIGFSAVRGEVVALMRLPEEIAAAAGRQAVEEGVRLQVDRGAKFIGLGGLTAPATAGGRTLLAALPAGVTLTNGNAYTAAVARHNVVEACAALGLPRPARVAVVGCTGSVGAAVSPLLAAAGFELILVGRSAQRARTLLGSLVGDAVFSGDLASLHDADVVLVLTSDESAKLCPDLLSPGAVVVDITQPRNIPPEDYAEFARRGVEVVEGGIVRIPGYTCTYDLNVPSPGDTFACLAETYLFSREGIREHSVGRPTADLALLMERLAHRHGIVPRPLDLAVRTVWPQHS
jgi:predicted amino acid dehydrogenase